MTNSTGMFYPTKENVFIKGTILTVKQFMFWFLLTKKKCET